MAMSSVYLAPKARINTAGNPHITNTSRKPLPVNMAGLKNVRCHQGAQILNIPAGSSIKDLVLEGGASWMSSWAGLRGAVLKFHWERPETPVFIEGKGASISPVHSLMDERYYQKTVKQFEKTPGFGLIPVDIDSSEPLFCVHSSWCHPNQPERLQLFLPQGAFARTSFMGNPVPALLTYVHAITYGHTLFLNERLLPQNPAEADDLGRWIVNNGRIQMINIALSEGGLLTMKR